MIGNKEFNDAAQSEYRIYHLRDLGSVKKDCDEPLYIGRDHGRYYLSLHSFSKGASKEAAQCW